MKQNKIKVVVNPDPSGRHSAICKHLVECNLASTMGAASNLIRPSTHDFSLRDCYYVAADLYNFRQSPLTTYNLIELAASGLLVIVGCKKLPPEMEFLVEVL